MGDQHQWFKLWCSAMTDQDLMDLSLEDFGRWCLFGMFLKQHGQDGRVTVKAPARALTSMLRYRNIGELAEGLRRFPNCTVYSGVRRDDSTASLDPDEVTVVWRNWRKYQVDSSADRMRRLREKRRNSRSQRDEGCDDDVTMIVTTKRRGEEKRREPPVVPRTRGPDVSAPHVNGFEGFYALYPRKMHPRAAERAWKSALGRASCEEIMAGLKRQLEAITARETRFRPHPATWLNGDGWKNEAAEEGASGENPYATWPALYDCGACDRGCHETLDARDACRAERGLPALPR